MKIFSAQLKGTTIVVSGSSASITGSFTGSIAGIDINATNTFTSSTIARLNSIEIISSSNDGRVGNIELFTSSTSARLNSIETISASNISRISALETTSASVDILNTTQNSRLDSLEIKTGSLATTGSNTFIGTQTITGSLFISSNLIVQGTSSLQNITASAVSIGTNIVNLNTANPAIRYAGLVIGDSGSVGGSGSFLYDSVQDEFIFVHRGTSTVVTSSVTLMGPETYDNVGNETYLTNNRLPKGTGNEHLADSNISDDGTTVTLISRALSGTSAVFSGDLTVDTNTLYVDSTNNRVGIGTASPSAKLHIGESGAAAQLWLQRTDGYNPVKLIGGTLADGSGFKITMNTTDAFAITSGGNVLIGTTTDAGFKLDVSGTGRFTDAVTIRSSSVSSGGSAITAFGYDGAADLHTTRDEIPFNAALYLHNNPVSGQGYGTGILFRAKSTTTNSRVQGAIGTTWTTATDGSRTAKMMFSTVNAGVSSDKLTIEGTGAATFSGAVTTGALTGTSANFTLNSSSTGSASSNPVLTLSNNDTTNNNWNDINFSTATTGGYEVIGKLRFKQEGHTYPYVYSTFVVQTINDLTGGLADRLTIDRTGAATFSSSVKATTYEFTGAIPATAASSGYIDYSGGGSRIFSVGTSGATKGTFTFIAKGADGSSITPLSIASTGAATFSSRVNVNGAPDDADIAMVIKAPSGAGKWILFGRDANDIARFQVSSAGAATFSSSVTNVSSIFVRAANNSDLPFINFSNADGAFNWGRVGGLLQGDGDGALYFQTKLGGGLTEKMRITSGGNVGIGTTAPANKLDVIVASSNSGVSTSGIAISDGAANRTVMFLGVNTAGHTYIQSNQDNVSSRPLVLQGSGGSVGIGTISPTSKLFILGNGSYNTSTSETLTSDATIFSSEMTNDAYNSILQLVSVRQSLSTGQNSNGFLGFSTIDDSNGQGIRDAGRIAIVNETGAARNSSTALGFWTNVGGTNTTSATERMRITSGGDVLVGTQTTDANTVGAQLRSIGLGIFVRSGGSALQLNRTSSDGIIASFRTSDVERGSISISGSVTSYNTTSDYRLKEDLQEIKGLEVLSAIKVYNYKWKDHESRMDGVLAHELSEVLPYAVHGEKDAEQMQGVDYSKIVPILIKAIQEQQSQIETLKSRIEILEQ